MARYVFLDRDGTINFEFGYVFRPEKVTLIPGAASAIARLGRLGYRIVIVSNQSAIGRGMATHEQVRETNAEVLRQLLAENGEAVVHAIFYSPDAPGVPSKTRKPAIGMLEELIASGDLETPESWMLGDKVSDMEFGLNTGIPPQRNLHLLTGHGVDEESAIREQFLGRIKSFPSIVEASEHIVSCS